MGMCRLALVAVLSFSAFAFGSINSTGEASVRIGEELIIEVLPEKIKLTDSQEERLQEFGYFEVRPPAYASNGFIDWVKDLAGTSKEKPQAGRRRQIHRARVVAVENETGPISRHSFSGLASYYHGRKIKGEGEVYPAAHRTLPFGTKVRVTYSGRSVVVIINDRGPFIRGRVIDIDTAAAKALGLISAGVGRVTCEVI